MNNMKCIENSYVAAVEKWSSQFSFSDVESVERGAVRRCRSTIGRHIRDIGTVYRRRHRHTLVHEIIVSRVRGNSAYCRKVQCLVRYLTQMKQKNVYVTNN